MVPREVHLLLEQFLLVEVEVADAKLLLPLMEQRVQLPLAKEGMARQLGLAAVHRISTTRTTQEVPELLRMQLSMVQLSPAKLVSKVGISTKVDQVLVERVDQVVDPEQTLTLKLSEKV
jgi:hypothetical protein